MDKVDAARDSYWKVIEAITDFEDELNVYLGVCADTDYKAAVAYVREHGISADVESSALFWQARERFARARAYTLAMEGSVAQALMNRFSGRLLTLGQLPCSV